jgi:hypothetical protein
MLWTKVQAQGPRHTNLFEALQMTLSQVLSLDVVAFLNGWLEGFI